MRGGVNLWRLKSWVPWWAQADGTLEGRIGQSICSVILWAERNYLLVILKSMVLAVQEDNNEQSALRSFEDRLAPAALTRELGEPG